MVIIAEINKNRCEFDEIEKYLVPMLYKPYDDDENNSLKLALESYIWSVIEPYVSFNEIETGHQMEDIFQSVCEKLVIDFTDRPITDFLYDVSASYSFTKKSLEIIHCIPQWNSYVQSDLENLNNIGCLACLDQRVIENKCIVISNKYNVVCTNTMYIDSTNKNDLIRIIKRRYYFSAILIKDNTIVKYYYQEPKYLIQEIFGLVESDTIEKLTVTLLGYNLTFYFKKNGSYINEIGTRINGLYRLRGDVLVIHEVDTDIYAGLTRREIKRLNVLSYGRLYDREMKPDELHPNEIDTVDSDGKQQKKRVIPLWNRYLISDKRMIRWQKQHKTCISCGKSNLVKSIKCTKCFRAIYCSDQCKKEFSDYHTDECINDKSNLI